MRGLLILAIFAVFTVVIATEVIIIIQDERAYRRINSRLKRKRDKNAISEFYNQYHAEDEEKLKSDDLQQENAEVATDREQGV